MDVLLAGVERAVPGEENLLDSTFQRLLHGDERHALIRSIVVGAPLDGAGAPELDDFVVGGYLTETYARKGWFQRLLEQVSHGTYDVGRDNGTARRPTTLGGGPCADSEPVRLALSCYSGSQRAGVRPRHGHPR